MTDRVERTIDAARRSFNSELLSVDYSRTHGDHDQVDRLVALLDPRPGGATWTSPRAALSDTDSLHHDGR